MFLRLVLDNVWIAVGLWVALFCADYILTIRAARMYQSGANKHFVFGAGYELNPVFQKDVARLRTFSFRFLLMLVLVCGVLLIIHPLSEIFALVWGMLIGTQLVVQLRHINNLVRFHYARQSRGMTGRIETDHWLSLRLSATGFLSFALLFLFLFLLFGSMVLAGATLGCLSISIRHFRDSNRKNIPLPEPRQGQ